MTTNDGAMMPPQSTAAPPSSQLCLPEIVLCHSVLPRGDFNQTPAASGLSAAVPNDSKLIRVVELAPNNDVACTRRPRSSRVALSHAVHTSGGAAVGKLVITAIACVALYPMKTCSDGPSERHTTHPRTRTTHDQQPAAR